MNRFAIDYYYESDDEGCCLKCPDAEDGCLCYDCKCKKCYWYESEYDKGYCELVPILKEEGRKLTAEWHIKLSQTEFNKSQLLREENKKIEKQKNNNWYSCQKCRREFISEDIQIIIPYKNPLCPLCSGKIIFTEKDIKNGN